MLPTTTLSNHHQNHSQGNDSCGSERESHIDQIYPGACMKPNEGAGGLENVEDDDVEAVESAPAPAAAAAATSSSLRTTRCTACPSSIPESRTRIDYHVHTADKR